MTTISKVLNALMIIVWGARASVSSPAVQHRVIHSVSTTPLCSSLSSRSSAMAALLKEYLFLFRSRRLTFYYITYRGQKSETKGDLLWL